MSMLAHGISGADISNAIAYVLFSLLPLTIAKFFAYVAFTYTFKYQVSRSIPLPLGKAFIVAGTRTIIGLLVGFYAVGLRQDWGLASAIVGMNLIRITAWTAIGWLILSLRNRRLVGWVIAGTLLNLLFDVILYFDWFWNWRGALVVAGIIIYLAILTAIGRRDSLQYRFSLTPRCHQCGYSLIGNLSGICPECGKAIETS